MELQSIKITTEAYFM